MAVPLVNGEAYSFVQLVPIYLGTPLVSLSTIDYTETQEKTNNPGVGNRPVSRGRGFIDASGSMELSMNDIEALREVATEGSLLNLPADDFILVFGNPGNVQTHVLKNLEFTTDGGGGATGDPDLKKTLDFVISHVKYR